jgi:predicted nucleic acid-binding protein
MGLILDSSVAVAGERRGLAVENMLAAVRAITGPTEIALSVVSVMELEHGIWRAKDPAGARRRRPFLEDLIGNVPVYPLTKGIRIAFPDLLIGVSALDLGYAVGTSNLRHFQRIPGLVVQQI